MGGNIRFLKKQTTEHEYPELDLKIFAATMGGGASRIEKQHERGKLTARERIDLLADPGSFEELDLFRLPPSGSFKDSHQCCYGDGVVSGSIRVNGRQAFVYAQDFTVQGGSLSKTQAEKICKVMDMAEQARVPIIALNDSGGARVQDGIDSLAGYGDIFLRNVKLSGVVPQIAAILGPCAGGAVYSPAVQDFIIMNRATSYMFVTGPKVVKKVIYEDVDSQQLGGPDVHRKKSGVAHFVAEDDRACIAMIARLLSYLPQNNSQPPPRQPEVPKSPHDPRCIANILPEDPHKPYDVRKIITSITDSQEFLEVSADFAGNICIGFGHMDGKSVGFVANQPQVMAGVLDINASVKAARFIRFCDSFNIPLITLVDVPGFMPGTDQESRGIILHGAKLLYAYAEATVPKVTLILRKAYGGAYIIMNSRHLGGDLVYSYPNTEIAVMGAEGAVELLYRQEAEQSDDPAAFLRKKEQEYREELTTPYRAAEHGYIDQIIRPEESRDKLITALGILDGKQVCKIEKKHGCIPL